MMSIAISQTSGADVYHCPTCGDVCARERGGYLFKVYCRCELEKLAKKRIERCRRDGITDPAYLGMRFDKDKGYNPEVCEKARRYAENFEQMLKENVGLLFTGGVGTGKTFYAAAIANALIDRGIFAVVTGLTRLVNMGFEDYEDARYMLGKADLVVFDDVGAERDTSFAWERAFDIFDARVRLGKPMIVTTNLTPKDMAAAGMREQRVYDRILGACKVIPVLGSSIRAREQREKAAWVEEVLGR